MGALARNGTQKFAAGSAVILDPWEFEDVAGQSLSLAFGFDSLGLGAEGEGSFGNLTGFAGTTLPGLETLFQYSITAVAAEPMLNIQFWSNPLLGLDDVSVVSWLRANIAPDPINGGFGSNTEGFEFLALTLNVPLDQPDVSLDWNVGATAVVVPEASTSIAAFAAIAFVIGQVVRRGRNNCA